MATVTGLGSTPSLDQLLATWQAWNRRDVLAQATERAADVGDTDRAATLQALLAQQQAPSATEALAAQHELASLLGGWRWQTVAAARAEGATWGDIAAATGTTNEAAEFEHATALERAHTAPATEPDAVPEVQRAVAAEFGATPDDVYSADGQVRPGPDHQELSGRSADHWYAHALDDADYEGVEPEETAAWAQHLSHLAGATGTGTGEPAGPPVAPQVVHTDSGEADVQWVAGADLEALEGRSRELEQRWLFEPGAREDDLLLAEWDVVDDEIERRDTTALWQHPHGKSRGADLEQEQRREQLARWHADDHEEDHASTATDDTADNSSGEGDGEAGWGR